MAFVSPKSVVPPIVWKVTGGKIIEYGARSIVVIHDEDPEPTKPKGKR